jgi:predicted AlkP superfamily phosphohydrolase/phosphomutase
MTTAKTFLIGLDGATFSVLDPLMEQGVMPFLKSFLAGGVRAGLRSIIPALTPPAWTSLMTGRTPGQHGVFDFFQLDSRQTRHIRFFNSSDVGCETIFSLASSHGLGVTALNYPSMFPPPRLKGYVVPGWIPWKQLRLACWPEDLLDRFKADVPSFNQRELAMDIKLEAKATEGLSDYQEYGPWIELHTRRERNWFEILRYLNGRDPSALTAILFDGVDKLQHLCWRFLCPADGQPLQTEGERHLRELCLRYFRELDGLLREICSLAGPDATVILASDHGFGPTVEVFHLNTWLEQNGYLGWSEKAASEGGQPALLGVEQVARHTWMLDWNRTTAFAATPTSNGIHIVVSEDGQSPGVPRDQYLSFRQRLMDGLRDFRDPASGEPVVTEIWTREQVFIGPHSEMAPDLTLVLRDGGLVSILPGTPTLRPRQTVAGAHRPVGVFAAAGPGIRQTSNAGELSILDVAPLILHSLGLPVPEEMQGKVPTQVFNPTWIARRPVRYDTTQRPAVAATEHGGVMTPEDEQTVLERLRDLGYIE